ncbi:MAG: cupin domain-containing protein [Candidatus Aenigmarchaeota archaeon]|nr:cupin domain-containing protein [Candidatus Aenigmarchaeota archaeon]
MLVKKSQTKKIENSKDCVVWEYEYPSELSSFATATMNGRYPDKNRVTNLECEEIYFVISGSGVIHSEFGDFKIEQGDVYFFKKGEKYCVDGKNLFMVLLNTPKWSPEQHRGIE